MEQQPTSQSPFIPNNVYRQIRRTYLGCVVTAMPLLFLALLSAVNKVGYGVPALLLVGGVGLLVYALLVRAGARCPRCNSSLMWKSGPMGMGRVSIGVKPRCPSCGLDLEQPWDGPAPGPAP